MMLISQVKCISMYTRMMHEHPISCIELCLMHPNMMRQWNEAVGGVGGRKAILLEAFTPLQFVEITHLSD
jgi:hypothetical protein